MPCITDPNLVTLDGDDEDNATTAHLPHWERQQIKWRGLPKDAAQLGHLEPAPGGWLLRRDETGNVDVAVLRLRGEACGMGSGACMGAGSPQSTACLRPACSAHHDHRHSARA